MNKLKKYLTLSVVSLSLALTIVGIAYKTYAATLPKTFSSTNNWVTMYTGPATVNGIQIFNPANTNALVYFYDTSTTNTLWTNSAYTNFTTTIINFTNIYTNIFGVLTTNVYLTETNSANAVAAVTNTFPIMNIIAVPSNSTVVSSFKFTTVNGLFATNQGTNTASNLVITIDYNRLQ